LFDGSSRHAEARTRLNSGLATQNVTSVMKKRLLIPGYVHAKEPINYSNEKDVAPTVYVLSSQQIVAKKKHNTDAFDQVLLCR